MRTTAFDLSPLFRTSIGFDRMSRLLDSAARIEDNALSYPPYNIEQFGEHKYSITMALAGFSEEDLDLQVHEGTLTVKSKPHDVSNEKDRKFLHRGIAARAFERQFNLAEHVEVVGADLENGLLRIDLERIVPDEKKPRTIAVSAPLHGFCNSQIPRPKWPLNPADFPEHLSGLLRAFTALFPGYSQRRLPEMRIGTHQPLPGSALLAMALSPASSELRLWPPSLITDNNSLFAQ